jgi:hypothetical protein
MDDDAMAIMHSKAVIVPGEEGLKDIRIVKAIKNVLQQAKRFYYKISASQNTSRKTWANRLVSIVFIIESFCS